MKEFASVLGYLMMVLGILGLLAIRSLLSPSPIVISLQVCAVLLMIWARITFGRRSFHLAASPTQGGLVTTGPYRYIRHPIYASVCLFVAGSVISHWSWETAALGALLFAGGILRIRCEEAALLIQYPEYRQYAGRTWRMVPYVF